MRKKRVFALGFLLVCCAGAVVSFRQGYWIPNYPSNVAFPVRGIDVSHHQGKIDWSRVKTDFAYIKATEGGDYQDPKFRENWIGSSSFGIRHGAYHYFTFKASGKDQAKNFIGSVPRQLQDMPPVVDLEFGGNSRADLSIVDFQRELTEFLSEVKRSFGSEPIIYTDSGFLNSYLQGFPTPRLWIRSVVLRPSDQPKWTIWQFSERMKVPGINGYVDQDVFVGTIAEFEALSTELDTSTLKATNNPGQKQQKRPRL